MERMLTHILRRHFAEHRQMALVSGPRQCGKSTVARGMADQYLNWDRPADRRKIVTGPDAVAEGAGLHRLAETLPVVAFDELHKFGKWKAFLKGFYDTQEESCRILVTGSARMDVYKRGGDSLMGRYFPFRLHPLSWRELASPLPPETAPIRPPLVGTPDAWESLCQFGGFPEPLLKASAAFHRRWQDLRVEQLVREDVRDATRIQETAQLAVLAEMLAERAGQLVNYRSLAQDVGVAEDTSRRWIGVLESFYYCFTLRPWFRNVSKSLRKQPKVYLWDWSRLADPGARAENLIACHLLKAVHAWNDLGLGRFDLHYLRDTAGREVDFLVSRERKPWFLAEVKSSPGPLSASLHHFQSETGAPHAFQVALQAPWVDKDCFTQHRPVEVPARTLLSQLV